MQGLDYRGLVEPWKAKLIVSRAKRMRFPQDDIEDVQQEIILDVLDFRYDPAKSGGATEKTALIALIDNRLKNIIRSRERCRQHVRPCEEEVDPNHNPVPACITAVDVGMASESLSPGEHLVCRALSQGDSKHDIAKMLGCGWHTVDRIIGRIRGHFKELNPDDLD